MYEKEAARLQQQLDELDQKTLASKAQPHPEESEAGTIDATRGESGGGAFGSKLAAFKDMVTRRRDSKTQSLMDALSESGSARTERVLANVLTRTRVH